MRHFNIWDLLPLWQEVLLIVVAVGTGTWTWFKFRHAHSWPSAQGTVLSVSTGSSGGGHFERWVAQLTYTYVVDGQYYSGVHTIRARSERRAEERIEGWKGRVVVVRYSPTKHEVSTLLRSDQPGGQLGN